MTIGAKLQEMLKGKDWDSEKWTIFVRKKDGLDIVFSPQDWATSHLEGPLIAEFPTYYLLSLNPDDLYRAIYSYLADDEMEMLKRKLDEMEKPSKEEPPAPPKEPSTAPKKG